MSKFDELFARQSKYSKCTMDERRAAYDAVVDDVTYAVDANILLDLYRVDVNTAKLVMEKLSELAKAKRLFIPHQACLEFLNNRRKVIGEKCSMMTTRLNEIDFKQEGKKGGKPDNSNVPKAIRVHYAEFHKQLQELIDKERKHIGQVESWGSKLEDDKIVAFVKGLPDYCLGDQYSDEDLRRLVIEGLARYSSKTPPGYMDNERNSDIVKNGDFLIWNQIIDYAKQGNGCNMILITGDLKEDWWCKLDDAKKESENPSENEPNHARHELMDEFSSKCNGRLFNTMTFTQFLTTKNAPADVIAEVADLPVINVDSATMRKMISKSRRHLLADHEKLTGDVTTFLHILATQINDKEPKWFIQKIASLNSMFEGIYAMTLDFAQDSGCLDVDIEFELENMKERFIVTRDDFCSGDFSKTQAEEHLRFMYQSTNYILKYLKDAKSFIKKNYVFSNSTSTELHIDPDSR